MFSIDTSSRVRNLSARSASHVRLAALACTAAIALAAGEASAQEADQPQDEALAAKQDADEIVVTGFRRSLSDSIDLKRTSDKIVESVSAEDLGKLPDVSIAEAIARLPGLAGQRVNGRVQVISIRGLSPDFSTTLLNGRQQVSSGDNRAAEFDQYPSELINSVLVYKTPDALLIGQGLSGTVDIRTVRPLAYGRRAIAVNARAEFNTLPRLNAEGSKEGSRFSISYIDQFADDTLGIALGYARLDSPTNVQHYKGYFYATQNFAAPHQAALGLHGQEIFATNREQVRNGVMGVVEWQPSDAIHLTLDGFYSKFRQRETMRGMQWFSSVFTPDGVTFTNPTFITVGGTEFNNSGVANNVVPILRNDYNKRNDELYAIGLNGAFELGGGWRLVGDLGYSHVKRNEQVLETYAGYGAGRTFDSIGYDIDLSGVPQYSPGLNYADASRIQLGDRAPWGGWGHDGAIRFPDVKDRLFTADARLNKDLADSFLDGFLASIDAGVNYTDRKKAKTVDDNDLFLKNGRAPVSVDPQYLVDPVSLGFAGIPASFAFDVQRALPVYYDITPIRNADKYNKDWTIQEKILTGYLQGNIAMRLLGMDVTGNVGVQIVHTDQQSTGFSFDTKTRGAAPALITDGAKYTDVLPSLNLSFGIAKNTKLRVGAAKTQARPRLDDLRASISAGINVTTLRWSGSGGNPELKPWKATALDVSLEHYFNSRSYVAVAGFYKDLDTYIYNQKIDFDFSNVPNQSGITPVSNIGLLTRPENGEGGSIRGYELSGAFDFGLLAAALEGLGVTGSYSHTSTSIHPEGPTSSANLPGLSGSVSNVTGYFERDGFSARISRRYRSAFRGEVIQLFATRGFTEILADKQVDAQVGYEIQDGPFQGLSALVQVNNLTNSPYRTRVGTKVSDGSFLPETYERYGRQILVGFNYRF